MAVIDGTLTPSNQLYSYAAGEFTVANGRFWIMANHYILTGIQRFIAEGTGRLVVL